MLVLGAVPGVTDARDTSPVEHRFTYTHPNLGQLDVVTRQMGQGQGDSTIDITNADGRSVYHRAAGLESLTPLGDVIPADASTAPLATVDALNHIFIQYNPGRYDGILVLVPVATGFDDLNSGWDADTATGRFYSTAASDVNNDGQYELQTTVNDCSPSCAEGLGTTEMSVWDPTAYDYVDAGPVVDNHACAVDATGTPIAPVLSVAPEVKFATGTFGTSITGNLQPGRATRYLLGAAADQTMTVSLEAPTGGLLAVRPPQQSGDGTFLATGVTQYRTELGIDGIWVVDVYACGAPIDYTVSFDIR